MRLMHESRETLVVLATTVCLMFGIGGVIFWTLGPDGWLLGLFKNGVESGWRGVLGLIGVVALAVAVRKLLDRKDAGALNNIAVLVLGLVGLAFLLHVLRRVF